MPFADLASLRLYYEVRGRGPRLLFLSGTHSDLRRRPSLFDSPLAEVFELLAFDPRGLGQSDKLDVPYSMADYAADAAGLLDVVGWKACAVMGLSFGGMVGQELALRYPERVERMVLGATSSGGAGGSSYPLHELVDRSLAEQARFWVSHGDTRYGPAWQEAHPVETRALIELSKANLAFRADEPGHDIGTRRQLAARRQHDTFDRLSALRLPVYLCGGRFDGIAPPALLESLRQWIPDARLELFEGGHGFLMQDPTAYSQVIDFLLDRPLP